MIAYLLQASGILTIFCLTYYLFLRKLTFFQANRFFLLLGLVMSIVIPLLPLNYSKPIIKYHSVSASAFEESSVIDEMVESKNFFSDWDVFQWLELVYFAGFSVFSLIFIFQLIQIFLVIKRGNIYRKNGNNLVFTDKNISPFSFFNVVVINPNKINENQWNDVLIHENIHINQVHQFDVMVVEITKIILWFFPLSWLYAKLIRINLEYIADQNSLANGLDRKNYQMNLLSISQQPAASVLANSFSKKLIKNRIKMLNKMRTNKKEWVKYGIIFPLGIFASISMAVKAQSTDQKIKNVYVITEDSNLKPSDIQLNIRNSNGTFEPVDSSKIKTIESAKPGNYTISYKSSSSEKLPDNFSFGHTPDDIFEKILSNPANLNLNENRKLKAYCLKNNILSSDGNLNERKFKKLIKKFNQDQVSFEELFPVVKNNNLSVVKSGNSVFGISGDNVILFNNSNEDFNAKIKSANDNVWIFKENQENLSNVNKFFEKNIIINEENQKNFDKQLDETKKKIEKLNESVQIIKLSDNNINLPTFKIETDFDQTINKKIQYYIDDKLVDKSEYNKLKPESIKSIKVNKNDSNKDEIRIYTKSK